MRIQIIIFFFLTTYCFSQKKYVFDYAFEYELTVNNQSHKGEKKSKKEPITKERIIYLTNSKNNAFVLKITVKDSLQYKLFFKDYNGIASVAEILKKEFDTAEFISIDCKYVFKYSNPFKWQIDNYDFTVLNDTVIEQKTYYKYKISSINKKREKRKKTGSEYYIVDKLTDFHLPILFFSTAFEEWKDKKNIPNGIYVEKYFIDYQGELRETEKLINYWKIDKKITLPMHCDFTPKSN